MDRTVVHSEASSREAFERYWQRSRADAKRRERLTERLDDGTYADNSVQRHWWTWQNAMRSAGSPPQMHRAFEIADEAQFELLLAHGSLGVGGIDATVIGFTDENSGEVHRLEEASAAMWDAFTWLKDRGYVELGSDDQGEYVQVVRRPGEDV